MTEVNFGKYELRSATTHLDYVGEKMYRFSRDLLEIDEENILWKTRINIVPVHLKV